MRTYIVAMAISLIVSVLLTPYIRDFAIRRGWIDEPVGGRKIHKNPIPRVGGIAILIAMSCPLFGMYLWDNNISVEFREDIPLLTSLVFGSLIIGTIGILDDLFNIRALFKLGAQVAAALVVYFSGIQIEAINIPFLSLTVFPEWLSLLATVFWITLVINAINLIDGMDGLAGSVVVLAGLSLFIMSLLEENTLACLLLISLVGATIGFLVFNLNPASVFLGDTGSMFLGFVLALTAVHSSQKSYTLFSMVGAIMVLGLPIFDLSMAILRRFLAGKHIFSADQYHIHHILLRKGFSQKQSVLVLFVAALALESLAFMSIYADDRLAAIAILALVPIGFVAVRFLGYTNIISTVRRGKMFEQVEKKADLRLETASRFKKELVYLEREQILVRLSELAQELDWYRFEISCDGDILHEWPRRRDKEHLQNVVKFQMDCEDGTCFVIWQLSETQVFSSYDRALNTLVVTMIEPYLRKIPYSVSRSVAVD
ncbi:MAG: MraY family glycosyltransferase [Myxococcota bacterium]|nr:MraY family glycosyltransferase [Myxococcota bacterium]